MHSCTTRFTSILYATVYRKKETWISRSVTLFREVGLPTGSFMLLSKPRLALQRRRGTHPGPTASFWGKPRISLFTMVARLKPFGVALWMLSLALLPATQALGHGKYKKCNVCPLGQFITLPKVEISIQKTTLSCGVLELAGKDGLISPSQCNEILLTTIPKVCGCLSKSPGKPSKMPVKRPVRQRPTLRKPT